MAFKKMRPRKKVCVFCKSKIEHIDYKDIETLQKYVNPDGKIAARSQTGNCAKHQRAVASAIKKARFMALLPEPGQR